MTVVIDSELTLILFYLVSQTAIASSVREGTLRDHGLIGPVQLYVTRDVTDQDELFEVICCVTLHVVGAVESCCLHLQQYY